MKKTLTIVAMCCAFALTAALVGCGGGTSASSAASSGSSASAASTSAKSASASASASSSGPSAEETEYNRAVALFNEGKYYSAQVAFEKSGYKDWEERAAECIQPMPMTGELYHNDAMTSDNMILSFTVKDTEGNAGMYITVYTKDNELVEALFVNGSDTIETWIPGGEYYIKDSMGTEWYGEDEQFGPNGHYETMVFDEVEGDRYLTVLQEGYEWDITINATSNEGQDVGSEESDWEHRA